LGTYKDNNDDKEKKGRGNHPAGMRCGCHTKPESRARGDRNGSRVHRERMPRGEANTEAKLTEAQVIEIRKTKHLPGNTYPVLGKRYGVTPECIQLVVYRKTWAHLP